MVIRQAGVTLIELMIVIVIIGLLAVAAAPFTQGWIDEARVNDARSQLHRAHAEAKALALRNPEGVKGNEKIAACMTLDDELLVSETCNGDVVWRGKWPSQVTLQLVNAAMPIRLNNRGQILRGNPLSPVHDGLTYRLHIGEDVKYGSDGDDNRLR